jgi:membrane protein YdbS with pleckstrin-like domain
MMIRQHWFIVCKNQTWPSLLIGAAGLLWALNTHQLARFWKFLVPMLPRGTRFAVVLHYAYLADIALFVLGALSLIGAILWWQVSTLSIDDTTLIVQDPFDRNVMPLAAIQDVQTSRSPLGILFNYGTLLIYSGVEVERIEYVPDVESFAEGLYHLRKR